MSAIGTFFVGNPVSFDVTMCDKKVTNHDIFFFLDYDFFWSKLFIKLINHDS